MIGILTGAIILSILHPIIPTHWLPIVLIGKSEKWSKGEILGFTAILAFSHTLSTVLIGVLIGFIGYSLSQYQEIFTKFVASFILLVLGIFYIIKHLRQKNPHVHIEISGNRKFITILSLTTVMFFSPCIEIEAYYLAAGTKGWGAVLAVSLIYVLITLTLMEILVILALRGMDIKKFHTLEHKENLITGLVLIALSFINLLIQ